MNLYIYTVYSAGSNPAFTRSLTVGKHAEPGCDRCGIDAREFASLIINLELNTYDVVPDELLGLTFKDDRGREWQVDPTWGFGAESGCGPNSVWTQLEITLQPVGGAA